MSTEGQQQGGTPAPTGGTGGGCKDPTEAYIALQCFVAHDAVVGERRANALEDMKTRITAVTGIQVAYEDALAGQKSALEQLLQDLKSIRKTVECQVTDRRDELVRWFCKKVKQESGGSPLAMPSDPCPKADKRDPDDLEELRTAQAAITSAIEAHQRALDELVGIPSGLKTTVEQLAAKVKNLNTKICDKTIDPERAFVMHLHYRWEYVQLRRKLTDSTAFVCRIYDLLDELFTLYAWDVCVAGAIAWLEKKQQLEDERTQGQDAETVFIDDVLRCSRPKEPPTPPGDDTDDVDELDPCRYSDGGGKKPDPGKPDPGKPDPGKPDPDPYAGGGEKGEPTPTQQYPPTGQAPQAQTGETQPPPPEPTAAQS